MNRRMGILLKVGTRSILFATRIAYPCWRVNIEGAARRPIAETRRKSETQVSCRTELGQVRLFGLLEQRHPTDASIENVIRVSAGRLPDRADRSNVPAPVSPLFGCVTQSAAVITAFQAASGHDGKSAERVTAPGFPLASCVVIADGT